MDAVRMSVVDVAAVTVRMRVRVMAVLMGMRVGGAVLRSASEGRCESLSDIGVELGQMLLQEVLEGGGGSGELVASQVGYGRAGGRLRGVGCSEGCWCRLPRSQRGG